MQINYTLMLKMLSALLCVIFGGRIMSGSKIINRIFDLPFSSQQQEARLNRVTCYNNLMIEDLSSNRAKRSFFFFTVV